MLDPYCIQSLDWAGALDYWTQFFFWKLECTEWVGPILGHSSIPSLNSLDPSDFSTLSRCPYYCSTRISTQIGMSG